MLRTTARCVSGLLKYLSNITETTSETVKVRGTRFVRVQLQAEKLKTGLKKDQGNAQPFFWYVSKQLWAISSARDYLQSSSKRQQHVAQHLNEFRQTEKPA